MTLSDFLVAEKANVNLIQLWFVQARIVCLMIDTSMHPKLECFMSSSRISRHQLCHHPYKVSWLPSLHKNCPFTLVFESVCCLWRNVRNDSFHASDWSFPKNQAFSLVEIEVWASLAVSNEKPLSNLISETNYLLITLDKSKQKFNSL